MEENTSNHCRNCESLLAENASFCSNCGQRNTDGRITFKELFARFMDNLFELDNRVFQTMGDLVRPGKLTQQFFKGKHIRYYHPVRLFVLSGAVFIAMLSYITADSDIKKTDKFWESRQAAFYLKNSYHDIDSLSEVIISEMSDTALVPAFDSLKKKFIQKNEMKNIDSVFIENAIHFGPGINETPKATGTKIALDDLINLEEDSIATKYGKVDFQERLYFIQNIRIQKSIKNFIFYIIGNLLWMIFIMMPMLALVLRMLYSSQRFLYIEHLIFSFHTHTFFFTLFSLIMLFYKLTDINMSNWAMLGVGIYLLLAMKRFYNEKWGRTIWKFLLANILYFIVFVVAVMIMSFASVFLF